MNELEKIRKQVFKHPNAETLEISRIPKKTVIAFKEFANEEYVGDYGMSLKGLLDHYLNREYQFNEIYARLNDLNERIELILNNQDTKDKEESYKYVTMGNGKKIRVLKKEN